MIATVCPGCGTESALSGLISVTEQDDHGRFLVSCRDCSDKEARGRLAALKQRMLESVQKPPDDNVESVFDVSVSDASVMMRWMNLQEHPTPASLIRFALRMHTRMQNEALECMRRSIQGMAPMSTFVGATGEGKMVVQVEVFYPSEDARERLCLQFRESIQSIQKALGGSVVELHDATQGEGPKETLQ